MRLADLEAPQTFNKDILLKWRIFFYRSGMGPETLHGSKLPVDVHSSRSWEHTLNSKELNHMRSKATITRNHKTKPLPK